MALVGRESAGVGPRDVFPELGVFIFAGMVLGGVAAGFVSHWTGLGGASVLVPGTGAGLGAILGLFVGLGRGLWRPGQPWPAREPERLHEAVPACAQLWDP